MSEVDVPRQDELASPVAGLPKFEPTSAEVLFKLPGLEDPEDLVKFEPAAALAAVLELALTAANLARVVEAECGLATAVLKLLCWKTKHSAALLKGRSSADGRLLAEEDPPAAPFVLSICDFNRSSLRR